LQASVFGVMDTIFDAGMGTVTGRCRAGWSSPATSSWRASPIWRLPPSCCSTPSPARWLPRSNWMAIKKRWRSALTVSCCTSPTTGAAPSLLDRVGRALCGSGVNPRRSRVGVGGPAGESVPRVVRGSLW